MTGLTEGQLALLWRATCRHEAAHAVATSYFSRKYKLPLPADGLTRVEVPSRAAHDALQMSLESGSRTPSIEENMAENTWDADAWLKSCRATAGFDGVCSAMVVRSLAGPVAEYRYIAQKSLKRLPPLGDFISAQPSHEFGSPDEYSAALHAGVNLTDMDYARHFASLADLSPERCLNLTRDVVVKIWRHIEALAKALEGQPAFSGAEAVAAMKWETRS